ncbi:GMC oxidoreductase-domain-containing protein [Mycena metata]|uniref:GMC oxidoreductase-domain-containing protein n=1 Tax=Mycena metata TaxID=1033252 RepID=A0AAD7IP30_9AGAR|nr:GMC oxidoreductase-domain-containing protein [Mycena metata]
MATQFDVIFAGGGATACVAAGRLAAADPSLKILIIEAGKHTKDISTHTQPGRYFRNLATGGDTFTFHVAKPSESLGNRLCIIPSGKGMGGGSSVNFMMYTRASPSDYDDWENFDNPGWGSKDLIPLSNKAETVEPSTKGHGTSGPIKIRGGMVTNVAKHYLAVAKARDKERGFTDDANDFSATYVSSETGKRSDAAHHYVYNQADNKNLQILAHCRVKRVIFEGDRAVGVEYISHDPDAADKEAVVTVRASRLVVLAAGAFGSPAILERSGIGAPAVLKAHDIQQIVDLPGVGENYNDHNLLVIPYHTTDNEVTMDAIFRGKPEDIKVHEDLWLREGNGMMAHNGLEAGIKIRPTAKDLEVIGSTFNKRWQDFFANNPDKPVAWVGPLAGYTGGNPSIQGNFFVLGYFTLYPASIGRTHITSSDPFKPLEVEPGFLDKQVHSSHLVAIYLSLLRWAYKWSREMARRMDSYRGEYALEHPLFAAGSAAVCGKTDGPVSIDAPDIVYSAEDDEAIDNYHRAVVGTTWHSLGTCAMKPRSQSGVVDSHLNVYGVKNLKVTDLSIAPSNVGSNTYNSALTIGEKAAMIIAEDLGIKGV